MSEAHAPPADDEPKSPMWLPALGAALFLGGALWWAVTPSSTPAGVDAAAASASAVAAPTPPANAAPPATVAAAGTGDIPGGTRPFLGKIPDNAPHVAGGASANPLGIQERMNQLRQQLQQQHAPQPPGH